MPHVHFVLFFYCQDWVSIGVVRFPLTYNLPAAIPDLWSIENHLPNRIFPSSKDESDDIFIVPLCCIVHWGSSLLVWYNKFLGGKGQKGCPTILKCRSQNVLDQGCCVTLSLSPFEEIPQRDRTKGGYCAKAALSLHPPSQSRPKRPTAEV